MSQVKIEQRLEPGKTVDAIEHRGGDARFGRLIQRCAAVGVGVVELQATVGDEPEPAPLEVGSQLEHLGQGQPARGLAAPAGELLPGDQPGGKPFGRADLSLNRCGFRRSAGHWISLPCSGVSRRSGLICHGDPSFRRRDLAAALTAAAAKAKLASGH